MSYSPSKIGQQLSVNAQLSQRNSFKILDSQEYEIPAIDFEKLGVNTIAPKDRTIITDLEYADVDSIAGEISPGNAVAFDEGISNAWVNNTAEATQLTSHPDTDKFTFTPHVYQAHMLSSVSSDPNVQTNFVGVPQSIDVIVHVSEITDDGTDISVLIPKIPVIGTCSLYRNYLDTVLTQDEGPFWSSGVCTSFVATLYTQDEKWNNLAFNNIAITERFPISGGGSRSLTAWLNKDHNLYVNDIDAVAQSMYKGFAGELCEVFKVNFNTYAGSNPNSRPQFTIRYRIVPIAGLVRNSLSDTLAANSSTSLVGRQHFYAIPESVSALLATDFIVTNTRTTVWHTEDFYDMYIKLLGKIGNTSIYLACKVNETSDYCSYGLAMKSDAVGRIVFPSNGEWIVENNGSSPNSSVSVDSIKTIDVSDADGKEDYLVALSIGDKKYVIALSSVRASYVNPLAYGNSSLVPVDPLIVSNTILSKPSLSSVELSMTSQFSPYSVIKKSVAYTTGYTPNLPGMKDVDGKLFVGSYSAISRSISRRLLATYGQQNFAFVDKIFSNAHFESYAASSVYNSVDVFPVLYPSYSLYSNLALVEPAVIVPNSSNNGQTADHMQFVTGLSFYNVHNDSGVDAWEPLGAIPFGWTNGTPVTTSIAILNRTYACSYKLGTVLIVNLPAVDRYGTPEQVMFTQDVIGAEFLNSAIVQGTSQILTSTRYVATDTSLYKASDLYYMSTVKNNTVYTYGKASKGFLSVAQFVFVVGESVTHIFSEDRNGIVCLGGVAGAVAQDPVIYAAGMMMVSVEKNAVVLYSVSQGNITPIKRITYSDPYTATALLKFISGVGLVFAVRVPGATFMYLVTERACSLAAYIPNTSSLACTDFGGMSSILFTVYGDTKTRSVSFLNKQEAFTIRSSAFAFPLIEGMKCLLVGMKLSFEPTTTADNSFGLIVSANNRVVKADTLLQCEIENVIMFDKQYVVGTAAYTISNCTGRLRNVSWLVSPMPIVQDTIEAPPVPVNQLAVSHSSSDVTMTLQCPTKLIWELSCSDNYTNTMLGFPIQTDPSVGGTHTVSIPKASIGYGAKFNIMATDEDGTIVTGNTVIQKPTPAKPNIHVLNVPGVSNTKTIECDVLPDKAYLTFKIVDGYVPANVHNVVSYSKVTIIDIADIPRAQKDWRYTITATITIDGVTSDDSDPITISST